MFNILSESQGQRNMQSLHVFMTRAHLLYYRRQMRLSALIFLVLLLISVQGARRRTTSASRASTRSGISIIGKGIASLARKIRNGQPESDKQLISGDEVEQPPSLLKMHEEMGPSPLEMVLYVFISLIAIGWIVYCLCIKLKSDEEEANWQRIREKHKDREKNYSTLMAIAEHGVHPDRANGKIYRIKL